MASNRSVKLPPLLLVAPSVVLLLFLATDAEPTHASPAEFAAREPFSAQAVTTETVVALFDGFDRPDSPTLGSPWIEGNEVITETSGPSYISPGYIELEGNTFAFHYENHSLKAPVVTAPNARPYALTPLAQPVTRFPATVSLTFAPHQDERAQHIVCLMSGDDGLVQAGSPPSAVPSNGIGVHVARTSSSYSNSKILIVRYDAGVRTVVAEKNPYFQFDYGMTYTLTMTVTRQFSATVTVAGGADTDTISGTFGSVSFPLDHLIATDLQGGISTGTTGPGVFRFRLDDILVAQPRAYVYLPLMMRAHPSLGIKLRLSRHR